jgi:hypothetical protein
VRIAAVRKLMLMALTVAALAYVLTLSASPSRDDKAVAAERVQWVEQSLKEMQTVKVGMTRGDLLKVFTEEGGLSTRTQQTYIYRGCPYFKVDVTFKPVGGVRRGDFVAPGDKIVNISRPYLDWSILD